MSEGIIPFLDFHAPYRELKEEFDAAYQRFMESGQLVLGAEVAAFEKEYAAYCGAAHCVGVGSGLEALHLTLLALECGPGDDVIVPTNTYIATWLAVTHAGANIVPVEPDPTTYNIDVSRIEAAITSKTKVILAVNLYGQPCDYDAIIEIARLHGLKVAIDNAQAHGARYKDRPVGGIADIECHSFYPSKNLGAYGEAGAITSNDRSLADRVGLLRNYGSRTRYENEVAGYNARLDELQAAFLRIKLRRLDAWNTERSGLAELYLSGLRSLAARISLPSVPLWTSPAWHLFVVQHPERDGLQEHLTKHGVQSLIHYPVPPHLSNTYRHLCYKRGSFPIAERLAGEVLSLPVGPHLSRKQATYIANTITSYLMAERDTSTVSKSGHP